MQILKNVIFVCMTMCMLVGLTACKNNEKYELTAWKSLATIAVTYDQTMSTLGDLHTDGKISDETAQKAIDFGHKFTPLYLAAVESLEVFVKNPADDKVDVVRNAIQAAMDSLDLFVEFANSFGVNKTDSAKEMVTDENAKNVAKHAAATLQGE